MTILTEIQAFAAEHGREIPIGGRLWCYYRLGQGAPILWLTGGLRRAALGFAFMQQLAERHTVIALDYPAVMTIAEYMAAFDATLQAEGVTRFVLAGQSYGGILAQAYLAYRPQTVQRLILSSTGPADLGRGWLPAGRLAVWLAQRLPEGTVKGLLTRGLLKSVALPQAERLQWQQAFRYVLENELTRQDVVAHFAAVVDLVSRGLITPAAYKDWTGRVAVLAAQNDPTQSRKDLPRYEALFGRPVAVFDMGQMGHAAALFDPGAYVQLLERALA